MYWMGRCRCCRSKYKDLGMIFFVDGREAAQRRRRWGLSRSVQRIAIAASGWAVTA